MTVFTLIITPHIRPDDTKHPNAFAGTLDGELICTSETPLFDSARELLRRGMAQPDDMLEMRHASSAYWAMRGKIGKAAKLTIEETGFGPKGRRYRPRPTREGAPRIAPNEGDATTLADEAQNAPAAVPP